MEIETREEGESPSQSCSKGPCAAPHAVLGETTPTSNTETQRPFFGSFKKGLESSVTNWMDKENSLERMLGTKAPPTPDTERTQD